MTYLVFFFPLGVQLLILYNDLLTRQIAMAIRPNQTRWSLILQGAAVAVTACTTLLALAYARAMSLRWKETFFHLNPRLETRQQPKRLEWMKVKKAGRDRSSPPSSPPS